MTLLLAAMEVAVTEGFNQMFADCDHLRFHGGGVGHKATRTATKFFKNNGDKLDFEQRQARARFEDVEDEIEPDEE